VPGRHADFNPRPRAEGGSGGYLFLQVAPYFNPRPRAEGGEKLPSQILLDRYFNPRPRAEGGRFTLWTSGTRGIFQPTPSCRGRRVCLYKAGQKFVISTHALVQRAASPASPAAHPGADFNPRPRAEGGLRLLETDAYEQQFQPTPSCRGRLAENFCCGYICFISTHALVQRAASGIYLVS